jgi:hypothetical protein
LAVRLGLAEPLNGECYCAKRSGQQQKLKAAFQGRGDLTSCPL